MDDLNMGGGVSGAPNLAWLLFQENGQIGMYSLYRNLTDEGLEDERLR